MTIEIKDLLDSKTENSVLTFFLLAPPRSFGTKELSKRLRMPAQKLTSAINKLTKTGHVKSFSKRGIKYYILNDRKDDLNSLKRALTRNKTRYQDELMTSIKKTGQLKAAFLSGLFTGSPELPVDLLLVGKVNLNKLHKFLGDCKKMIGQEINYSIMSEGEFRQRRDTFDRFIKDIFDYRHVVVIDNIKK